MCAYWDKEEAALQGYCTVNRQPSFFLRLDRV